MRTLEEYGKWKAGILITYELDSKETIKLGGEIRDRLERMGLKIPTILEIRDEHHIEENIRLINPSNRIYMRE
jgi:hypothetical protein